MVKIGSINLVKTLHKHIKNTYWLETTSIKLKDNIDDLKRTLLSNNDFYEEDNKVYWKTARIKKYVF